MLPVPENGREFVNHDFEAILNRNRFSFLEELKSSGGMN